MERKWLDVAIVQSQTEVELREKLAVHETLLRRRVEFLEAVVSKLELELEVPTLGRRCGRPEIRRGLIARRRSLADAQRGLDSRRADWTAAIESWRARRRGDPRPPNLRVVDDDGTSGPAGAVPPPG